MPIEVKQLETLRAIAEAGSFSAAAERLRLTQSAVSQQLKKLEEELGETLIARRRPRVELTHAGMRVLSRSERIFKVIEEIYEDLRPVSDGELSGTLRVTTSTLAMVYIYGDLIADFIAAHPRVELLVSTTENSQDAAQKVLSRTADVAFGAFPITLPNIETRPLGESDYVLIASAKYPLAQSDEIGLDEIRRYRFVRFEEKSGTRMATDRIFAGSQGYPPILLESNNVEFIKRMVGLGLGLAFVPSFTIRNELKQGTLRTLKLRDQDTTQEFGIVYRSDARMRLIEVFRRFCLERPIGSLRLFKRFAPT